MTRIYVSHASSFDYQTDLYEPLTKEFEPAFELFLPHSSGNEVIKTRDVIRQSDYLIAEVSRPSTGQGIELGWADISGVKIVCIYKVDSDISGSLKFITKDLIEYSDKEDMIAKLGKVLSS